MFLPSSQTFWIFFVGGMALILITGIIWQISSSRSIKITYTRAEKVMKKCPMCGHEDFHQVRTNGTFLVIDMVNRVRHIMVGRQCQRCGYIAWFADVRRKK